MDRTTEFARLDRRYYSPLCWAWPGPAPSSHRSTPLLDQRRNDDQGPWHVRQTRLGLSAIS
ncbi:hypothetical protein [Saccharothrix longispora]|uniref:hypothetical protein n=1 Tax=Saccharothrix longispora TaxID=33920 RepID=UPI0028FD00CE|nr:hypothetical protein [Saccharothrix longispora]MBY8852631.1 hypothetical protein [Saccharothrix sp. MB29]MDU0288160.1 hypothetical protein [Saccharothrix longispora]